MSVFKQCEIFEAIRSIKMPLNLEIGIVHSEVASEPSGGRIGNAVVNERAFHESISALFEDTS